MGFKVAIPARYGSTRLPGKPLRLLEGKPLLQYVFEQAQKSGAEEIVIATDNEQIKSVAEGFGAEVCMTDASHPSGSDRLAEVAKIKGWSDTEIIVNLQGDEPLMPPELIHRVADDLANYPAASISTVCTPIHTTAELFDPHVVKVVMDKEGFALYFSRAPIPWDRDAFAVTTEMLSEQVLHYRHIGLYGYRAEFLHHYSEMSACALEATESLEQLRALWHGKRIHVTEVEQPPGHGVDTEDDLMRVERIIRDSTSTAHG